MFAEDFVVDCDLSCEVGMNDLYCVFNQLHRRLKSLQITKQEFVLMKSIALVNSGKHETRAVICFVGVPSRSSDMLLYKKFIS